MLEPSAYGAAFAPDTSMFLTAMWLLPLRLIALMRAPVSTPDLAKAWPGFPGALTYSVPALQNQSIGCFRFSRAVCLLPLAPSKITTLGSVATLACQVFTVGEAFQASGGMGSAPLIIGKAPPP